MKKKRYDAFALAKERTHLKDRLSVIVRSDDVAGEFLWNCFSYFYAVNPVETLINLPSSGM